MLVAPQEVHVARDVEEVGGGRDVLDPQTVAARLEHHALCAQLVELQHSLLDRIDLMRLEPSQDRGPRDGVISQQVVALGEAGELGAVEAHQIERVQLHVVGDALRGRRGVWITAPRDLGAQDQIRICVEEEFRSTRSGSRSSVNGQTKPPRVKGRMRPSIRTMRTL